MKYLALNLPGVSLQRTIQQVVSCTGVGVHSGKAATLSLFPVSENSGYTFVRTDLPAGKNRIPATYAAVTDTRMCTTLTNEQGASVHTVEHIMAALAGAHITNVDIHVDGPEIPIMDGSAVYFAELIQKAGFVDQAAPVKSIRIVKNISVHQGEAWATYTPHTERTLTITFDAHGRFKGWLNDQHFTFNWDQEDFGDLISDARTFGFYEDAEKLWSAGLAKGASLYNTVVIQDQKIMNEEGLRSPDEFVRHKILDAVGDLSLAGVNIIGQFSGYNSGHGLNNQLLRAIFDDPSCYVWC